MGHLGTVNIKSHVSLEYIHAKGCSHLPGVNTVFHVAEPYACSLVTCLHLNDSVAEFQRVEKLDEGRHLEPVLFAQAVPLLIGNLQLGGQR